MDLPKRLRTGAEVGLGVLPILLGSLSPRLHRVPFCFDGGPPRPEPREEPISDEHGVVIEIVVWPLSLQVLTIGEQTFSTDTLSDDLGDLLSRGEGHTPHIPSHSLPKRSRVLSLANDTASSGLRLRWRNTRACPTSSHAAWMRCSRSTAAWNS